ncbi:spore coat protein X [Pullulanibacillus pueri]|uniref:Spore coat protein X n=1 Tax=Pullulanibacillus pueri TaxID=1437324 RepID=A0A8J3ELT3_9BACL|nr:spore coat protein [Pullulanibacillus pueri]MBM7682353.1 spore coat protein X [Pullulanibacillus pueri]GGH80686.1 spore coat protein X [Pullulanibacillus pueri]
MSLFNETNYSDCHETKRWSALDDCRHPLESDPTVGQNGEQVSATSQTNDETIIVKDSCDIEVTTRSTEVAVNIQLALQVAIAVILEVSIASDDSFDQDQVLQDLLQLTVTRQSNRQKTIIENSRGVRVSTTDTDVAVTAQIAIQILVAILIIIDIL